MRLTLFIGPSEEAAARLRGLFKACAKPLRKNGFEAPDWNHVRLYAACAQADEVGILRYRRGFDSPLVQQTLTAEFHAQMTKDLAETQADHILLSAAQLGNLLHDPAELARLKALLSAHFAGIRIVAHVGHQAEALIAHYTYQVVEGRRHGLSQECELAGSHSWWQGALDLRAESDPHFGLFRDVQHPPFWLDYQALFDNWAEAFGSDAITLRPLDTAHLKSADGAQELGRVLGLSGLGPVQPARLSQPEPAVNLTRMRLFNGVLIRYAQVHDLLVPRDLWKQLLGQLRIPGPPIEPGSLGAISDHFADQNAALIDRFPDLAQALTPPSRTTVWQEAEPQFGFRATQYLAAFAYTIRKHSTPAAEKRAAAALAQEAEAKFDDLLVDSSAAHDEQKVQKRLLNRVKVNHRMILSTQFKPHNNLGAVDEEQMAAAYTPAPPRALPPGSSGNVIVACMKNEAPFILEWVAYHRAIGVDNILIYINDCSDGTEELLTRLDAMGMVHLRENSAWKGNSPQQHALNKAVKEPLVRDADWIIHIDVDEFINVRTGNGTLDDLVAAVPDATNIAMTWRLFGHNGITDFRDDLVIDQFDACAPKFCPKPHTVWGFKTMFRNIGAYRKLSCHRPNKLADGYESRVKWVNGSGHDITRDMAHNGWRSSKGNIGYDLVQLNHYALRSAESFLVKRQRGRALHVDRSIGINYWIRMDWSDYRDITIKRNIPRVRAEIDRLMQDETLRKAHQEGVAWHRAKATELRHAPEFEALFDQALAVDLTETERVAYALALDMET